MSQTTKMRALQTLPQNHERPHEIKRGEPYDATEQEARDHERRGWAQRAEAPDESRAAKGAKA